MGARAPRTFGGGANAAADRPSQSQGTSRGGLKRDVTLPNSGRAASPRTQARPLRSRHRAPLAEARVLRVLPVAAQQLHERVGPGRVAGPPAQCCEASPGYRCAWAAFGILHLD